MNRKNIAVRIQYLNFNPKKGEASKQYALTGLIKLEDATECLLKKYVEKYGDAYYVDLGEEYK